MHTLTPLVPCATLPTAGGVLTLMVIAIAVVALCFALLAFNLIFRKNGRFPETEIGRNKNMRKLGITCVQQDERNTRRKNKSHKPTPHCKNCGG
jgi:hypothetical protein